MGVTDLRARGAIPLPRRLLRALDKAAIREEILDPREAGDRMDFVEQYQAQDLANPGDRTQQVQGLGIMLLGRCEDGELHVAEQRVVVANQREVDCDAL